MRVLPVSRFTLLGPRNGRKWRNLSRGGGVLLDALLTCEFRPFTPPPVCPLCRVALVALAGPTWRPGMA
jgi:hypothetical protein